MNVSNPDTAVEYGHLVDSVVYLEGSESRAILNELLGDGVWSIEAVSGDL